MLAISSSPAIHPDRDDGPVSLQAPPSCFQLVLSSRRRGWVRPTYFRICSSTFVGAAPHDASIVSLLLETQSPRRRSRCRVELAADVTNPCQMPKCTLGGLFVPRQRSCAKNAGGSRFVVDRIPAPSHHNIVDVPTRAAADAQEGLPRLLPRRHIAGEYSTY